MWTRGELKEKAKVAFKANYWHTVLICIVLFIFTGGGSGNSGRNAAKQNGVDYSDLAENPLLVLTVLSAILVILIIAIVLKIVVGNCLIVGAQRFLLDNSINTETGAEEKAKFKTVICIFKSGKWGNVTLAMFLKDLFVSLWYLLLIVPGVIKAYQYRMVPYILADEPDMNWKEALATSKEMMEGQKWNAFVLDLSFIGWFLLSAITLGVVGVFWTNPYYYQTNAELYLALLNKQNIGATVE